MADSLKTFQVHLTAVMDSLVRASVCEITKLFQDTVNDYLVEISLNRKENEALKLRLRLTENKLRNERKYGLSWASRRAGLTASDDGGRKKRKADMARGKAGKEWSGRAWEEGVGEAREEGRDVYLVHLPEGEEEEREERRRASGEGKEPANIKEESAEREPGYRPDSLRLIQEALQMEPSEPKSTGPHSHTNDLDPASGSVGLASDNRSPSGLSGAQEDWKGEPACADGAEEGGASVDELSGLETALRAEREREKARSGLNSPTQLDMSDTRGDMEYVMSPKYIGLDGLCSSQQQPASPHRAAGPATTGWTKRAREAVSSSPPLLEEEEGEGLQLPSATGSLEEESGGEGGDFLHFCTHCGGGFNSTQDLEDHACPVGADEEQPFQCATCARAFSQAWALKNHECVPNGERPHRCELCGKRFMHSRSLERHQLVHTGERPHRCPQCGRSFSRLGNLERHQRIHTGERPYECGACGKRFSRVEYLKRHQHIHSSDRAEAQGLQCQQCGKTCSDAEQLKQHQCFYNI
ncbi:zinc finger protein with KRAB and SCAN domains 8 isoform X2 [Sardina pilchardus]|uniref:zinc finger protein with KRAB and SCAN domains 8 isoform X2 n=1 Tax=Sardina pilchardus TaxID=27697 RepID=UPI002E0EB554